MAKTVYECMMILEPNMYARDPGSASTNISEMIENLGGSVLVSRLWNEQKLAYPIEGHRKGVYWLTYLELESTDMSKLNRQCQLNALIVRHMAIKIDPRLVETLLAVARGEIKPSVSRDLDSGDTDRNKEDADDSDDGEEESSERETEALKS